MAKTVGRKTYQAELPFQEHKDKALNTSHEYIEYPESGSLLSGWQSSVQAVFEDMVPKHEEFWCLGSYAVESSGVEDIHLSLTHRPEGDNWG